MSKIGFYLLGIFSGIVLPSLYAWTQADEANMAKPEVSVIKEYAGAFQGWDEDHVQRKAYRMGYCECNCQQEIKR